MSREGWTGLQRREATTLIAWMRREQLLSKGFDALANALREIVKLLAPTPIDAREIWAAASSVIKKCDDPTTYSMRGANAAYAWLHLLDRYVRTWLALERLLRDRLLPMGKYGVRVLDVGTGPGPSAFATHDFYAALGVYSRSVSNSRWDQPPHLTCVEQSRAMNHFRHILSEILVINGAPQSIFPMTGGLIDFADIHPRKERRELETRLRHQFDEYYDGDDCYHEPIYTADEANREANSHHRYRLFTFSNFLTTLKKVSATQDNLEEILFDARPGSVMLMIGGKGSSYTEIQKRMVGLAKATGFRRGRSVDEVSGKQAQMEDRLAEEACWLYRRLKNLAGPLPAYDEVTQRLLDELEGRKPMRFGTSAVHAFRK